MSASGNAYVVNEHRMFIQLFTGGLIPLYVVVPSLTWVIYDYFITLEDEVEYIWKQKRSFGKFMFLWIRYYTIFLLIFDVLQIHGFSIRGVPTKALCIAVDPTIRFVGGVSLWSVEIIMQLRVYALYNRSKKIALFNGTLFFISMGLFLYIMIINTQNRGRLISEAMKFPLPGCPAINGGSQWSQWLPATIFEFIMFGFVLYKAVVSATLKVNGRVSLAGVLIHENILYFAVVTCLLVFNNLMVVRETHIPWFGYGPFHAAIGIMTCRMLIHLRKFSNEHLEDVHVSKLPDIETSQLNGPVFIGAEAFQPWKSDDESESDSLHSHKHLDMRHVHDEESLIGDVGVPRGLPPNLTIGEAGPSRIR